MRNREKQERRNTRGLFKQGRTCSVIKGAHYFAQLEQINIQVKLACFVLRRLHALQARANIKNRERRSN